MNMKKIYILALATIMVANANAESTDISSVSDAIYFERTEVKAGDNATLQIFMKNPTSNVGTFGTTVTLPDGISCVSVSGDPDVSVLSNRTAGNDFYVASAFQESSAQVLKIGFLQESGANLSADATGAVLAMNVTVSPNTAVGTYEVTFSEQEFVEALSSENYFPADAKSVIVVTSADGIDGVRADGTKAFSPVKKVVDGKLVIETSNGQYNVSGIQTK